MVTMNRSANEDVFAESTYEVANGGTQHKTMTNDPMMISNTKQLKRTNGDETNGHETNGLEKDGVKSNVVQFNGTTQHPNHASLLSSILSLTHDAQDFARSQSANKEMRSEIRTAALALANSLEDSVEQAIRIVYETSPPTVALRIAFEGGFLRKLANGITKTAAELGTETGVESALIARIMRVLTASKMVDEVDTDTYAANELTRAFLQPGLEDAIRHSCDNVNVIFTKLPEYLANTDFQNPTSYNMGPHVYTFGRTLWKKLELEPRRSKVFDKFMMAFKQNRVNWVEFFPFQQKPEEKLAAHEVLIVDVAGGIGHRVIDFRTKHPQASGRAVLQDLPYVLPSIDSNPDMLAALQTCGVELMDYDYTQPQPIQGARYYFFSAIFHGKPDSQCLALLQNTALAMTKGYSRILINDFVLPDKGVTLFQASMDLWMMAEVTGKERNLQEWAALLAGANLRIIEVYRSGTDSVIEIELAG